MTLWMQRFLLFVSTILTTAASSGVAAETDLSGMYDVGTLTPLERPKMYGDKLFLTPEEASAIETPIGNLPSPNSIDFEGLNLSERDLDNLLKVEIDGWLEEIPLIRDYYSSYGDRVPKELKNELSVLTEKLRKAKKVA